MMPKEVAGPEAHSNVVAFATLFLRPDLRVAAGGRGQLDRLPIVDAHMKHLEFEARLCTPLSHSRANGGAANPNIARAQWERMLSATRVMRSSNGGVVRGAEQSSALIVQRYGHSNDNVSSQTPIDAPHPTDAAAFRMKRKLGTIDLAAHGTPFDVRIAASLELPIERPLGQADVSERLLKRRWSFIFFGTLRCDFTKLEVLHGCRENADTVHQVEIELLDAPGAIRNGVSPARVWTQIQEVIAILAEAADGQRCNARYTLIRQRLQTRITI